MQLVFRTLSLNAPQCTDRLLALFFLFTNTKNEKHAQGCPLVAGQVIAPLTAEHWGVGGGGWGERTCPLDWPLHRSIPFVHREIKAHGTDSPLEQAAKAVNSCFCSFPLSSGLSAICTRQHLWSSFTVVLPALKTLQIPACTRTPSPGKGNQHTKKGKGKPFNTFSNNHDHNVMI